MVAPNEPAPVGGSAYASLNLDASGGRSDIRQVYKKMPWLSASLYGMPLMVMFTLLASVPRILIPVYPMPFPASEFT